MHIPQTVHGQRGKDDEESAEVDVDQKKRAASRGQRSPVQSMRS